MKDGWINDELNLNAFVPTMRISLAFDAGLVLVTLIYLALYALNGMTLLVACSIFCLVVLAVSFYFVRKGPDMRYIGINIFEITFFMVMNVVFLGTEYGFQLYVFGFLTASMLLSLSAGGRGKILMPTKVIIVVLIIFYTVVTFWFGRNTPMYSFNSDLVVKVIFMLNSLTTMGTIILFTGVYMASAASLAGRLVHVALHDALTGLLNRHGFFPIIAETYERAKGKEGVCWFAMLDIDHFKDINDTYGHDAGDMVLQKLADLFRENMEKWPGLQIARWGGEEFLMLFEPQNPDELTRPGPFDIIRAEMVNNSVTYEGAEIHWTVTLGVADCIEGNTLDDIISLSDKRLYEGKQNGRNRVVYGPWREDQEHLAPARLPEQEL